MRPSRPSRTAPVHRRNNSASPSRAGSRPTRSTARPAPEASGWPRPKPARRKTWRGRCARSSGAPGLADREEVVGLEAEFDREANADRQDQQSEQQPQMLAADFLAEAG